MLNKTKPQTTEKLEESKGHPSGRNQRFFIMRSENVLVVGLESSTSTVVVYFILHVLALFSVHEDRKNSLFSSHGRRRFCSLKVAVDPKLAADEQGSTHHGAS